MLRQRKLQMEAQQLRVGILEGFQDIADGRLHEFKGSLNDLLKSAKS
jgi:formate hydrogenlyase subunit 4